MTVNAKNPKTSETKLENGAKQGLINKEANPKKRKSENEPDQSLTKKQKSDANNENKNKEVVPSENSKKNLKKKKKPKKKATDKKPISNEPKIKEVEEHKLFIKNLPGDVKDTEIKALSADIIRVRIKKRAKSGKAEHAYLSFPREIYIFCQCNSRSFAYVVFETREATEKNYEELKNKTVRNNPLVIDFLGSNSTYTKKTPKKPKKMDDREKDMKRLHVSGFSKNTKEDEIKSLFPKCTGIFMPKKRDSEINLKFAFVQFEKEKHAKAALEKVKESKINGKQIVVDYACIKTDNKKTTIKDE